MRKPKPLTRQAFLADGLTACAWSVSVEDGASHRYVDGELHFTDGSGFISICDDLAGASRALIELQAYVDALRVAHKWASEPRVAK